MTEQSEKETSAPKEKNILDTLKLKRRASIHSIHDFFGKLIPAIPAWAIMSCTKPKEVVLDPFCGSGTVLVEARLLGRNSYGIDIDPIAQFITKVKTTPLMVSRQELELRTNRLLEEIRRDDDTKLKIPDFPNRNHWFEPQVQKNLALIKKHTLLIEDQDLRDFFLLCFSSMVRRVSNADPRQLFPERTRYYERRRQDVDVFNTFQNVINDNVPRVLEFRELCSKEVFAKVVNLIEGMEDAEARETQLKDETIDLIVTNPPYVSSVDYVRALRLRRYWLELVKRDLVLRKNAIGMPTEKRPTEIPEKIGIDFVDSLLTNFYDIDEVGAFITHRYFIDMKKSLQEMFRVLKKNGRLCLKIGGIRFKRVKIPLHKILINLAEAVGFKTTVIFPDEYKTGRSLLTKRSKFSGMIPYDWILIFQK